MSRLYALCILFLLFALFYCLTGITHESFLITNKKTSREAVNGIKHWKKVIKNAKKENIVVVIPSYDKDLDKKIDKMIKSHFETAYVTIVTFTDKNLIQEFLSNVTTETVNTFPAFYRINLSDSKINHLEVIHDRPQIIEGINTEIQKLKAQKKSQDKKDHDKKGDKGDKKDNKKDDKKGDKKDGKGKGKK